ncbi:uncharacterized protein SCHCODRAFT_02641402 [Schizophyllum commune H4-8]|uniref:Expressed protein n=1 Tax=Schizophyllum commune (strain H4-8 / FGSC 9210) TaxID=578458 RepID=D8QJK5_SCHCM|nr:uncharacterized protein SCHCODRAFT_02641402 [Schizophyllum commune H4-8]KAI5886291.1 hypothetical protein SCHCODRAFT_02641402 [Schizophyllum commune H4-8]
MSRRGQLFVFTHYDKRSKREIALEREWVKKHYGETLPVPPEIVTFRSGEGGLFKSHYSNLRGVLYWKWRAAPPGTIIDLPEDTYTTNLLFNDIIRRGPVSLDDEPIEGVCALAEMSAKYDLDYITFHCHLHMDAHKEEYPLEIAAYAHKNGHSKLLDLFAPFMIAKTPNEVRNKFPPVLFTAWTEYVNAWRGIIEGPGSCSYSKNQVVISDFPNGNLSFDHDKDSCEAMASIESAIYRTIAKHGVALLLNLEELKEELEEIAGRCTHEKRSVLESKVACAAMVEAWISQVEERKSAAPFSDFVNAVEASQ